jgi:bis(5'-nucleosyl)-tetraphosphatase (symmetrical)
MALYLIGDLQGCLEPLQQLLRQVDFSPSRDTLYPLGDLVNRGPHSLGVLRTLMALQDAARPVLGNHDLHLLACAAGVRPAGRRDTLQDILQAPDRPALVDWLRQQPLARLEHGWLMVHAGVLPDWTSATTLELAGQVSQVLRSAQWRDFFHHMYGNQPERWHERLQGWDRLRVIVNGLIRLRFCTPDGAMEFEANGPPSQKKRCISVHPPVDHVPVEEAVKPQAQGENHESDEVLPLIEGGFGKPALIGATGRHGEGSKQ